MVLSTAALYLLSILALKFTLLLKELRTSMTSWVYTRCPKMPRWKVALLFLFTSIHGPLWRWWDRDLISNAPPLQSVFNLLPLVATAEEVDGNIELFFGENNLEGLD